MDLASTPLFLIMGAGTYSIPVNILFDRDTERFSRALHPLYTLLLLEIALLFVLLLASGDFLDLDRKSVV